MRSPSRLIACTRPSSVGALLALSIAVLVATAVWLGARQREQVYATASRSLVDVSVSMAAAIGALLEQSASSLRGLSEDLVPDQLDASRSEATLATLRTAMRYDPASAFLGVRTPTGLWIVGRDGVAPGTARREAIGRALPAPAGGVRLSPLVQLPGDATWYLPLDLPVTGSTGTHQLFALVPARGLLQGSESLRLLDQSFVTLAGTDGQRLLRYGQHDDELTPNGPPLSESSLQTILGQRRGWFIAQSPLDGQEKIFGFATSARLPLLVSVAVPTAALDRQWIAASVTPAIVLLLGIGTIAVFGLRLMAAVGAQRRQQRKENWLATHDSLTGLLNRDAFVRSLGGQIERGRSEPLLVVVMDLNHFKDINETLGHAAGDELLQIIAARLEQLLQERDATLARLGGDELALCMRLAELHAPLEEFCAGLQHRIGHHVVVGGVGLEVTASMGAVTYPADGSNAAELLRCADIAMYAAKDEMKPFMRYEAMLDRFTAEALALKAEFTQALRDGLLSLVYQPKLSLATGELVGVEALCRWTHPTRGPISPARFMPLVESTELIHPFTAQVLERALQQAARWMAAGHRVPVAVNISVNNLLDPQFANKLMSVLGEWNVPPELLELEVTESAVMRQPDVVQKRLETIHQLGVKLSIDDFGTGYASLAYLKRLPVDSLKIDRVFVAELDADEADRRIVKSSIQLAHGFDMTVVAEGVESEAAATLLRQFGCDMAQGFHFARPLSAAEIEACWLGRLHALPLLS